MIKLLADATSSHSTKAKEQLLETYMNCDQFMSLLKYCIFSDLQRISQVTKQQCANMLDRIAIMRIQNDPTPLNLHTIFKLHFEVLLDWKISYSIKKFFSSSIEESLDIWQEGKSRIMQNSMSSGRLPLRLV